MKSNEVITDANGAFAETEVVEMSTHSLQVITVPLAH
jgi:hypothetical protein